MLLMFVLSNNCFSQKTNYVGLDFTFENASGTFQPGIGMLFERKVTHHSGIETGLYYRNYKQDFIITVSDSVGSRSYYGLISERHISIPVQYKFYSRFINLTAGPTFEFYIGWKQKNKTSELAVSSYDINPAFSIGFIAKASKDIRLAENFILEPEVRFNPIFTSGRRYIGFGIAGKYQL